MPLNFQLTVARVFERVGYVPARDDSEAAFETLVGSTDYAFPAAEVGAIVYWPRELSWLNLRARGVATDASSDFRETPDDLRRVCEKHKATESLYTRQLGRPDFLDKYRFIVGSLAITRRAAGGCEVRLPVGYEIDTNSEPFCKKARASREQLEVGPDRWHAHVLDVSVTLFLFDQRPGVDLDSETGTLTLSLTPAAPAPADAEGLVALDLGNTSSCLVWMRRGAEGVGALQVLDADRQPGRLKSHTEPTSSQVRIDRVRTYPDDGGEVDLAGRAVRRFPSRPSDDLPKSVVWTAGRLASGGTAGEVPGNLVLGAKRLAAARDPNATVRVPGVTHTVVGEAERVDTVEVSNPVPAELIACRMFQRLREARRAWPRDLAVTYPTTYTRPEIDRLRRLVQRAWLRMQVRQRSADEPGPDEALNRIAADCQRHLAASPDEPPMLPRLFIDEASAAAFFFLYRKIFDEMPGRLLQFGYLYQRGLNLLLYDCGGGTTDIALVRAALKPGTDGRVLTVTVEGRSGVRDFGGDDITAVVARLLKAKLVRALAAARNLGAKFSAPDAPTGASDALAVSLRQFFDAARDADCNRGDVLVPTCEPRGVGQGSADDRRRNALTLWAWAERLKERFEGAASVKLSAVVDLAKDQSPLARQLRGSGADQRAVVEGLAKVELHRAEVDSLIADGVRRSVARCNALIHGRLEERHPGAEVHWVVVSGNGSRYPMISEALRAGLDVSDVESRFFMDRENLKLATAKGAALALNLRRAGGNVDVEFQSRFHQKLPFDVGYKNAATGEMMDLFREGDEYAEMAKTTRGIALVVLAGPNAGELDTFALYRRFPGEGKDGWVEYLTYHFAAEGGIRGDLEVGFTPDDPEHPEEFRVLDTKTREFGIPTNRADRPETYRSPALRGDF